MRCDDVEVTAQIENHCISANLRSKDQRLLESIEIEVV
jgi:hypothetical protein